MHDDIAAFVGTWRLLRQISTGIDGKEFYPRGEDAVGWLIYDGSGTLAAHLARVRGPLYTDLTSSMTALQGFLAYVATYTVQPETRLVLHHVLSCSYAPWIGQTLRRAYQFAEDRQQLMLTATTPVGERRVLHWQRVG